MRLLELLLQLIALLESLAKIMASLSPSPSSLSQLRAIHVISNPLPNPLSSTSDVALSLFGALRPQVLLFTLPPTNSI